MIRRLLSKLYNSTPKELLLLIKSRLLFFNSSSIDESKAKSLIDKLQKEFRIYQTTNLHSITTIKFFAYINSKIGILDAQSEGYADNEIEQQRDLSIRFHWGHNHNFGNFEIKGRMGNRHIYLMANFITFFPISIEDFKNKSVFDIGCWTGGTTLLLALIAEKVFAIEEVNKYAEMTSFLVKSFGINDRVTVKPISIYECNSEKFHNRFDIVYFPGVIYHLSDPILALRILYNSLKMNGTILIESAGINVPQPYCRFWGNKPVQCDNHSGWAWFRPSPSALVRMMKETGFEKIEVKWHDDKNRIYAYGKKISQVAICKAGLSIQDIK